MNKCFKSLLSVALLSAAGCCSVTVPKDRIGVCSWSWQKPMKEVAVQMDEVGVKGIHLALGPFIAPDGRHGGGENEAAWQLVKDKVAKGEWNVMSTMIGMAGEDYSTLATIRKTGGIVPDKTWATNQKVVTRGAQLTKELGCAYMSAHAGFLDVSDPKAYKTYVERVSWMRDECRKYGVTLILESGQETAEDLAKFMDDPAIKANGGVGINFDPANMILYDKGCPRQALQVLYPWIRQIHVKDARKTKVPGTWGKEAPWGDGEVGGKEFLADLAKLGYTGNYVIEREGGKERPHDIALAIDRLTK